jgi:hypothetical protein
MLERLGNVWAGCIVCSAMVWAEANAQTGKDVDLACAITAGAEMGASPKGSAEQSAALMVWTFYLGRLSARDDTTNWNTVIKGKVAELRERARPKELYSECMKFYSSKMTE